jgi:hypothetical protein
MLMGINQFSISRSMNQSGTAVFLQSADNKVKVSKKVAFATFFVR